MFPPRGPGIGLLLLRISVAATFVLIVLNWTKVSSVNLLFAGALLIAIFLIIGFLTPYLSFIVCVSALLNLFVGGSRADELLFASLIPTSAALGLLGPGAYSLDARLFGRRVVIVRPRRNADSI